MINNSKNGRVFSVDDGKPDLCESCSKERADCNGKDIKFMGEKLNPRVVECSEHSNT
jgi:hypothetical protein